MTQLSASPSSGIHHGAAHSHRWPVGPRSVRGVVGRPAVRQEFDAGQPIVYLSTDAGLWLTSVLERSTYVPALNDAAYNGGDDFLGSSRERLFGIINGQTGPTIPSPRGFSTSSWTDTPPRTRR